MFMKSVSMKVLRICFQNRKLQEKSMDDISCTSFTRQIYITDLELSCMTLVCCTIECVEGNEAPKCNSYYQNFHMKTGCFISRPNSIILSVLFGEK